jgi:hypothetical protein
VPVSNSFHLNHPGEKARIEVRRNSVFQDTVMVLLRDGVGNRQDVYLTDGQYAQLRAAMIAFEAREAGCLAPVVPMSLVD